MSQDPSTNSRRQFLKLGLGSAAGAAAAAAPVGGASAAEAEEAAASADYRETDHVKTFYKMARF